MEEFEKEVVNLEKLRGHSNIVQIRDHTVHHRTGHVVILMELAACDLDTFFKRSGYSSDVSGMLSIWHALVDAVSVAHTEDIIHRDLKPHNFLLVPIAPPFADRILSTTKVPSENFEFRIVNRATTKNAEKVGDVELILKDSPTGPSQVLQLIIKVSDFGLAQPLDLEENASHLSVEGHAGTIKYMAPEAFQASEDGVQRLTKHVDIWALGVMLFQMLHGGRTPFDAYCCPGKPIRAAVAIASRDIHAKVMIFDRQGVWATERKSLQERKRNPDSVRDTDSVEDTATNVCQSSVGLLSTEFLFRMCENCLAFEAPGRVLAEDLKTWVGHLLDSEWWEQTMQSLSEDDAVQALFSGVSVSMEEDEVETASQLDMDNLNLVRQGGDRIEQVFFRELRRTANPLRHVNVNTNIVALPATGEGVEEREQRDDEEQLHVVVLPTRGEAVEEREQADDGVQSGVISLSGKGGAVEKCEQADDGEKCEEDEQLQAAQELLPRCINEEDFGRQGAVCASEHLTRPRRRGRRFAPLQSGSASCGCKIMGIIGVAITVLAVCLFVVLKLIPEPASQEPAVSFPVPPAVPTFLAPTTPLPSPTAPMLVDPTTAPKVLAPTNLPASSTPVSPPAARPPPAAPASSFRVSPAPALSPPAPPFPTRVMSFRTSSVDVPASPSPIDSYDARRKAQLKQFRQLQSEEDRTSFILAAVATDGLDLAHFPEEFRANRKIVLAACKKNGLALSFATDVFRTDKEIVMAAINSNPRAWGLVSPFGDPDFLDPDFLFGAHCQHSLDLPASPSPIDSYDARKKAQAKQFCQLQSEEDRTSFILAAVATDGLDLAHFPDKFRANREIVLAACKQNGLALSFATDAFRDRHCDEEIAIAAIKSNSRALDLVSPECLFKVQNWVSGFSAFCWGHLEEFVDNWSPRSRNKECVRGFIASMERTGAVPTTSPAPALSFRTSSEPSPPTPTTTSPSTHVLVDPKRTVPEPPANDPSRPTFTVPTCTATPRTSNKTGHTAPRAPPAAPTTTTNTNTDVSRMGIDDVWDAPGMAAFAWGILDEIVDNVSPEWCEGFLQTDVQSPYCDYQGSRNKEIVRRFEESLRPGNEMERQCLEILSQMPHERVEAMLQHRRGLCGNRVCPSEGQPATRRVDIVPISEKQHRRESLRRSFFTTPVAAAKLHVPGCFLHDP